MRGRALVRPGYRRGAPRARHGQVAATRRGRRRLGDRARAGGVPGARLRHHRAVSGGGQRPARGVLVITRDQAERMLGALHAAQAAFYAGEGDVAALRELLTEDVRWHVPGRNAIAGTHEGIDAVLAYFARRRKLAARSFRMHPRELLVGDGDHVAAARIAEVWLLPLNPPALRPHLDQPKRRGAT